MDDFSTLMPGHELVIERARQMCRPAWPAELAVRRSELKTALEILDAGNHERAREILEGRAGPFPTLPPSDNRDKPEPVPEGVKELSDVAGRNVKRSFEG